MRIALAGNANVGKSALFNQLTGLHQHMGNWPGKTIAKAEGKLNFKGTEISVIDLPGIYSLRTFSIEEMVSREYIAKEKPDVVINVVDASVLERNLFFTLQLLELERPMVVALNMIDVAEKKGIDVDIKKLSKELGVPVVPMIAIRGIGVQEIIEEAIKVSKKKTNGKLPKYRKNIEKAIDELRKRKINVPYPARWTAIKLLEGDEKIIKLVDKKTVEIARKKSKEIQKKEKERSTTVITADKYVTAERISRKCLSLVKPEKIPLGDRLDGILLHRVWGYFSLVIMALGIFYFIFSFGDFVSGYFDILYSLIPEYSGFAGVLVGGIAEGIIAGLTVALPYLIPFFILLAILEDSGYLARMAFLMDGVMHKIGLHGKAFIPLMLGYGCSVPGCLACRIMETDRERLIAGFVVTLIPCAARTVVILGLVGVFLGIEWALAIYIFNLIVVFILGRIAFKALPGEPMGLIMEMPSYKTPILKNVAKETWVRLKDFIVIAFPIIIISTVLIKGMEIAGLLEPISNLLSPITVGWLGLPAIVGITLIFGILRKELTLIMLAALLGTSNFAEVMTPIQMITFTILVLFYIPCAATIATLYKEYGLKKAVGITVFEIVFAVILSGLVFRGLDYFGIF